MRGAGARALRVSRMSPARQPAKRRAARKGAAPFAGKGPPRPKNKGTVQRIPGITLYRVFWWAIQDLNPGPSGYEPPALTS